MRGISVSNAELRMQQTRLGWRRSGTWEDSHDFVIINWKTFLVAFSPRQRTFLGMVRRGVKGGRWDVVDAPGLVIQHSISPGGIVSLSEVGWCVAMPLPNCIRQTVQLDPASGSLSTIFPSTQNSPHQPILLSLVLLPVPNSATCVAWRKLNFY